MLGIFYIRSMSKMSGKKLGFGLMRLPSLDPNDPGKIDIEQVKKMVDTFIERGFTYFDTAWMYCAFKSENAVKEALVSRHPRDSFTLTTKLHSSFVNSFEDRDRIFNEQMEKTGVTYLITTSSTTSTATALRRTISLIASAGSATRKKRAL